MNPKIVFCGNSKHSVIGAEIIHSRFPISLVLTIPDKPKGRDKILTPSPTKVWAQENKVEVLETNSITPEITNKLKSYNPDFIVVEDYGLILPEEFLNIPRYTSLNVHHSLLPKYRGASPAPAAILNGDETTGVTIIEMSKRMDAGDIISSTTCEISDDDTTDTLLVKLNTLGANLVPGVIKDYLSGQVKKIPQDESLATYTWKTDETREKAFFDIEDLPSPQDLDRMSRAFYPWPGAWTKWNGKIVKILPGKRVQIEGKNPVSLQEFLRGYPEFPLKSI